MSTCINCELHPVVAESLCGECLDDQALDLTRGLIAQFGSGLVADDGTGYPVFVPSRHDINIVIADAEEAAKYLFTLNIYAHSGARFLRDCANALKDENAHANVSSKCLAWTTIRGR